MLEGMDSRELSLDAVTVRAYLVVRVEHLSEQQADALALSGYAHVMSFPSRGDFGAATDKDLENAVGNNDSLGFNAFGSAVTVDIEVQDPAALPD